eukprot:1435050-Rhodomonas_salina.2
MTPTLGAPPQPLSNRPTRLPRVCAACDAFAIRVRRVCSRAIRSEGVLWVGSGIGGGEKEGGGALYHASPPGAAAQVLMWRVAVPGGKDLHTNTYWLLHHDPAADIPDSPLAYG